MKDARVAVLWGLSPPPGSLELTENDPDGLIQPIVVIDD